MREEADPLSEWRGGSRGRRHLTVIKDHMMIVKASLSSWFLSFAVGSVGVGGPWHLYSLELQFSESSLTFSSPRQPSMPVNSSSCYDFSQLSWKQSLRRAGIVLFQLRAPGMSTHLPSQSSQWPNRMSCGWRWGQEWRESESFRIRAPAALWSQELGLEAGRAVRGPELGRQWCPSGECKWPGGWEPCLHYCAVMTIWKILNNDWSPLRYGGFQRWALPDWSSEFPIWRKWMWKENIKLPLSLWWRLQKYR